MVTPVAHSPPLCIFQLSPGHKQRVSETFHLCRTPARLRRHMFLFSVLKSRAPWCTVYCARRVYLQCLFCLTTIRLISPARRVHFFRANKPRRCHKANLGPLGARTAGDKTMMRLDVNTGERWGEGEERLMPCRRINNHQEGRKRRKEGTRRVGAWEGLLLRGADGHPWLWHVVIWQKHRKLPPAVKEREKNGERKKMPSFNKPPRTSVSCPAL